MIVPVAAVQPWTYETGRRRFGRCCGTLDQARAVAEPTPTPSPTPTPDAAAHADAATDRPNPIAGHHRVGQHGKPRAWPDAVVTPEAVGAVAEPASKHSVKDAPGRRQAHDGQDKSAKADPRMIAALTAALKDPTGSA